MSANHEKKQRSEELQALKDRATAIRPQLPSNYKKIIVKHYPQFDSISGGALIDNVRRGNQAHKGLTEILEDIASGKLTMAGETIS